MSVKLSINAKTYYDMTPGATPTWIETSNIKDATLEDSMEEADVTTRASGGFKETEPTLRGIGFDYNAPNLGVEEGVEVALFATAYATRAAIHFLILDGPVGTEFSNGVQFVGKLFKKTRSESLADAQMIEYSIKPCQSQFPAADYTEEA